MGAFRVEGETDNKDKERTKTMKELNETESKALAAVNAAVNAFNRELIDHHLHSCVARDLREGREEVLDYIEQINRSISTME